MEGSAARSSRQRHVLHRMRGAANAAHSGDRLSDRERKMLPLIAQSKTTMQLSFI